MADTCKVVLVAVDGSINSDWAFHAAVHGMNATTDRLIIVSVAVIHPTDQLAVLKAALTLDYQNTADKFLANLEHRAEVVLKSYVQVAKDLSIKKYKALLGTSSHAGEMICELAKNQNADLIVVGTRGLGAIKSMFLGSTSRYVLEHAACDVMVVKKEFLPAEIHESSKAEVRAAEEKERNERLSDPVQGQLAEVMGEISHQVVLFVTGEAEDGSITRVKLAPRVPK